MTPGTRKLIAIVEPGKDKIRLKEIRQFMAVKEMHSAIYFQSVIFLRAGELGKEGGTRSAN